MIKILSQIKDSKPSDIGTERLCLCPRLISGAEDTFTYASLSEVTWSAGFPPAESTEAEVYYLENVMPKRWVERKVPSGYGICSKGANKVIGSADFNKRHAGDVLGVDYLFRPDCWGQRFVSEATRALLEVGFTLLSLHEIEIECHGYNETSQHITEKLGFTLEARIRDRKDAQGKRCNLLCYRLLKSEWGGG